MKPIEPHINMSVYSRIIISVYERRKRRFNKEKNSSFLIFDDLNNFHYQNQALEANT